MPWHRSCRSARCKTGRRRNIDDLSLPHLPHVDQDVAGEQEGPSDVGAEHLVPICDGHISEIPVKRVGAGIIDQDVNAAKPFDHRPDDTLRQAVVGHIPGKGEHVTPFDPGDRGCLLQPPPVARNQPEAGALSRHRDGDGPSHSCAGAGDDGNLVL